ncbi:hypothetical protein [Saccharothrix sp. ST-888]|uniref:hypothetical protein n=1 Tax=Saccharothrix sp. ST-888 TaxID=1427391 RepID=UPI0005ECBEC3|nr:hypothetical protein [Saccharothrix sp. ST-888]KJK56229.1 hypothetical protein UK12_23895 [Saccharothrix sp. ST-888]
MTYAPQRSLRDNLNAGLTDGSWRKGVTGRGGVVEPTTPRIRDQLADTWYGVHEAPVKIDPFGRPVTTPDTHTGGPVTYPGG